MALPKKPKRSPAEGELPFEYDWEPAEEVLTAYAGVPLFVRAIRSFDVPGSVKRHLHLKQRQRGFDEATYVESFLVLNALGGDCLEDFDRLREDAGLGEMLFTDGLRSSCMRQDLRQDLTLRGGPFCAIVPPGLRLSGRNWGVSRAKSKKGVMYVSQAKLVHRDRLRDHECIDLSGPGGAGRHLRLGCRLQRGLDGRVKVSATNQATGAVPASRPPRRATTRSPTCRRASTAW